MANGNSDITATVKGQVPVEKWRQAVGRLTIAFGMLEHGVNDTMVMLGFEWLYEATDTISLPARCRVLRGLMKRYSANAAQSRAVDAYFKQLAKLVEESRNVVAHGAPLLTISESGESLEHAVVSPRRMGKRITLTKLLQAAEEAERMERKLIELAMEIQDNLRSGGRPA